jgi:hypothetical protein
MRAMNLRLLTLCVVLAGLAACKEKEKVDADLPDKFAKLMVPEPKAPAAAPAAQVRSEPGKGGKAAAGQAEVELFGNLDVSRAPGKKVVLFVSKEACDSAQLTLLASMTPPNPGPPNFFIEFFPLQGDTGHLCAVSLDEQGRVVGAAAHPKNPLTFKGEGEVVFDKIDLKLEPVSPPRAGPKF